MGLKKVIGLSFALFAGSLFGNDERLKFEIGQMFVIGCSERTWNESSVIAQSIRENQPGGIIFFNSEYDKESHELHSRNIVSSEQLLDFTTNLHGYWDKVAYKGESVPKLPLMVVADVEGGLVDRLPGAQGFKKPSLSAQALGCYNNAEFTLQYARQIVDCLVQHRINTNFAPVVDLNINPINPVIGGKGRSFSSDPAVVIAHAEQFITAHRERHVLTAIKHYPGHGSSTGDTHEGYTDITSTWHESELLPFKALIQSGYDEIVMTAHVVNGRLDPSKIRDKDGKETLVPMTFSRRMVTDILKNQWGFKGVVMTDDLSMGAIADHYKLDEALLHAIEAGVDMFILANHYGKNETSEAVESVYRHVKSGKISESRIHEAFQRIQRLKSKL